MLPVVVGNEIDAMMSSFLEPEGTFTLSQQANRIWTRPPGPLAKSAFCTVQRHYRHQFSKCSEEYFRLRNEAHGFDRRAPTSADLPR
jgi:hypothetical protein